MERGLGQPFEPSVARQCPADPIDVAEGIAPIAVSEPLPRFEHTLAGWDRHQDLWVFGYASLIWRPEFEAAEQRLARVHGMHRAFQMRSRVNRGTPEQPGLVFALVPGGSCAGMVFRVERERAERELQRLWLREMPNSIYDPRWLQCQTEQGVVTALAFTLSKRSPNYTEPLDDESLLGVLRNARGRFGTSLDYLVQTANCLRKFGIRDQAIERHVALARRHGLAA